ncbi:type II toxin-antitoxin system YoeB family toxin [Microbacterium sp. che218]|uniref:type II toxin-antitoxin system YoeB family toxin n=1 Tax=Microbacterium sp. che218 TaxID=3140649 RepID=UPI00336BC14D
MQPLVGCAVEGAVEHLGREELQPLLRGERKHPPGWDVRDAGVDLGHASSVGRGTDIILGLLPDGRAGAWSRRIDEANRLVRVAGDTQVTILQARSHY